MMRRDVDVYAVLLFTIAILCVGLIPGIGYSSKVETEQRGLIAAPHYTGEGSSRNRLFNGTISASFNPLLYPVSYLSGSDYVLRKFQGAAEVWDHEGTQIKEAVVIGTLFAEVAKNLPYFVAFGILLSIIVARLSRVPTINHFLAAKRRKTAEAFTEYQPESLRFPDYEIERPNANGKKIRRSIAISLIIGAYAITFIDVVYWSMAWQVFPLVIFIIILAVALF